jgi:succinyl-diaminopimelate desuccinylase
MYLEKNRKLFSTFDESIERDKGQLTESVRALIKIRSVAGEPVEGKPFGEGPAAALRSALYTAGRLGFSTKNLDNYIGFAEYGEGNDYIAVLGHVDTVPEGEHWTYPPFSGTMLNGRIYGRGALDDKGPVISALYSLKAIQDSGVPLTRRIRIIFGADEETGDLDIQYYLSKEKPPICGFTPDSEFPVVFAEKGILQVNLNRNFLSGNSKSGNNVLVSLAGGDAVNMVPDRATAKIRTRNPHDIMLKCKEFAEVSGFSVSAKLEGDLVTVISEGVSSHASRPNLGINAVMQLIGFLSALSLGPGESRKIIKFLQERIGMDTSGRLFGLDLADEPSGHLTMNAGMVQYNGRDFLLSVDIRYPVTKPVETIIDHIHATVKDHGISVTVKKHQQPLYYPPGSDLIRTLATVYNDVTGDSRDPVSIGGGTYARRLPNIVAFGPCFPGKANNIHAADESAGCDELVMIAKIYARAMYTLARQG